METNKGFYEIWDMESNNLVGEYNNQDRLMQSVYESMRIHGKDVIKSLAFVYVTPEEESIYLGDGREQKWQKWFDQLDEVKINLRLAGTDIIGLSEHLGYMDYAVEYSECHHPLTTLCHERYHVVIENDEISARGGGYTKLEALARTYVYHKLGVSAR